MVFFFTEAAMLEKEIVRRQMGPSSGVLQGGSPLPA
jgi:hypothetical protein